MLTCSRSCPDTIFATTVSDSVSSLVLSWDVPRALDQLGNTIATNSNSWPEAGTVQRTSGLAPGQTFGEGARTTTYQVTDNGAVVDRCDVRVAVARGRSLPS